LPSAAATRHALVPVILAGGVGTRLWPVSRETLPKHLARLVSEESLLQLTARRLITLAPPERVVTVCAKAQDFLVARQLAEVDPELIRHRLLEPIGRNTAAAVALAALYVVDENAGHWDRTGATACIAVFVSETEQQCLPCVYLPDRSSCQVLVPPERFELSSPPAGPIFSDALARRQVDRRTRLAAATRRS
jgi:Nucleotidyl transferase